MNGSGEFSLEMGTAPLRKRGASVGISKLGTPAETSGGGKGSARNVCWQYGQRSCKPAFCSVKRTLFWQCGQVDVIGIAGRSEG